MVLALQLLFNSHTTPQHRWAGLRRAAGLSTIFSVAMGALLVLASIARAADPAMPASVDVLDKNAVWRTFQSTQKLVPFTGGAEVSRDVRNRAAHIDWRYGCRDGPLPPAGWNTLDFDDQHWLRSTFEPINPSGAQGNLIQRLGVIGYRVQIGVDDPGAVKDLTIALEYLGGVLVYVNGQEVGRRDMPVGQLEPGTPADPHPVECYDLKADANVKATTRREPRRASFTIPANVLRKGVNVLAIENRRSSYRLEGLTGGEREVSDNFWSPVGIYGVTLKASSDAGLSKARVPVRFWNAGPLVPVDSKLADCAPFEVLRPVTLSGARGAVGSGQFVVSGDAPLANLRATPGPLTGPGGAVIPASAVRIRYAQLAKPGDRRYQNLADTAPADATTVPVWVSVDIPADAKPGEYTSELAVSGPATRNVPLRLEVFGWNLPKPAEWKSWSNFFQSPESLAIAYQVPLWSDKHFALIEQSMRFQAGLGERLAVVHACRSSLTNQRTMVLFRRKDGKIVPDMSVVERYLTLYQKVIGTPTHAVLNLWDPRAEASKTQDPDTATEVDVYDGDTYKVERLPLFGQPGTEETWLPVVEGMRAIMKKLNWPEERMIFGTQWDSHTGPVSTPFFAKHFPTVKWVSYTHGWQPPKPLELGLYINPEAGGGMGSRNAGHGWRMVTKVPSMTCMRFWLSGGNDPAYFRQGCLNAHMDGFLGAGGMGMDFLPLQVKTADGRTKNHSIWMSGAAGQAGNIGRVVRGAPSCMVWAGPQGPASTISYECFRDGMQDAQALIYVADNAKNPKLPPELAKRAGGANATVSRTVSQQRILSDGAYQDAISETYRLAAEMQAVLGK